MFSVKCPKCSRKVSLWLRNFKQWRSGIHNCNSCGARLKLSNGVFLGGFYGLCGGCLIVSSRHWGFESEWIRFVVVIPIFWFFWPILCRLLGHWRIVTREIQPKQYTPRIRKLSYFEWLSFGLSFAAMFSMFLIVWLQVQKIERICSTFDQVDPLIKSQLLDEGIVSVKVIMLGTTIPFGLFLVLFVIGIIFSVKKHKAIGELEFAETKQK